MRLIAGCEYNVLRLPACTTLCSLLLLIVHKLIFERNCIPISHPFKVELAPGEVQLIINSLAYDMKIEPVQNSLVGALPVRNYYFPLLCFPPFPTLPFMP
jgi:hypothetical protein